MMMPLEQLTAPPSYALNEALRSLAPARRSFGTGVYVGCGHGGG
jgi:hypothetical protein